jgi:hypothetical protein
MPVPNKNIFLVAYKLLCDSIFLLLIFFCGTLVAEGLIPGIITEHISFLKIIFILVFNLAAIHLVGRLSEIEIPKSAANKKTAVFLAVLGTLLVFNSLLHLNLFLAFLILVFILLAGYFTYRSLFEV